MAEKVMDSLVDKIDRMIKRLWHGCFHIGPISRSRSSSGRGRLSARGGSRGL